MITSCFILVSFLGFSRGEGYVDRNRIQTALKNESGSTTVRFLDGETISIKETPEYIVKTGKCAK
jgi:hypothetical protein